MPPDNFPGMYPPPAFKDLKDTFHLTCNMLCHVTLYFFLQVPESREIRHLTYPTAVTDAMSFSVARNRFVDILRPCFSQKSLFLLSRYQRVFRQTVRILKWMPDASQISPNTIWNHLLIASSANAGLRISEKAAVLLAGTQDTAKCQLSRLSSLSAICSKSNSAINK